MTIEDIAKLAKTSVATVSRVINNDVHVRPETKQRVLKVINEYNYRPNSAGKNLRQSKTFQVLAVLPTLTNPFFSLVIEGFSDKANQNGYSLNFVVSNRNPDKEKSYLNQLVSKGVDGMVLFYPTLDADTIESFGTKYPLVCIGTTGTQKVSRAGIRDFDAAYDATNYLISLGHKRIFALRDRQKLIFNEERENGFRVAMRRAGIEVDDSSILCCDGKKNAADLVVQAMEEPNPPTAFFAFSDIFAIAAMKQLTSIGYEVGKDLDIMGFDNIEFSQYVSPSLTTVAQPGYHMGENAFLLLQEKMEDINALSKEIIFPHEIVIRSSTASKI